jgi:hypothetical protein
MGGVNITLANGQLGQTIQTNDGICGMVLTGATEAGGYTLGTPVLITSVDALETVGISETNNPFAVRHVQDFYSLAGAGAQLYLMLVDDTMAVDDIANALDADGAKVLLDYAAGRIKVLAVMTNDDLLATVPTIANALNGDVYTAIDKMSGLADHFVAQQMPFRAIIGGTSYTGVPANLSDLTTRNDNRVAILVGDTESGKGAALGLLLGTLGSVPVQRKASRVATGALPVSTAFLATSAVEDVPYDEPIISSKGFITWKTYPHKSGYFWSGDHTATADSDDYNVLCRGRIIDKAHIIAYKTFVDVVDDEVPVDAESGKMAAGYCRALEQAIENQINNTMTANREISSITAFVDPEQNVLSTNIVAVSLGIVPVGYSSVINVTLGFVNPAL